MAHRRNDQATTQTCCGKVHLDRTSRGKRAEVRHLLGVMMQVNGDIISPSPLDVVALLANLPVHGLARGQVGTVVEQLDEKTLLVEFSDDQGYAYAIAPCLLDDLLVLHYAPEPA